jgi:hypothetical protein
MTRIEGEGAIDQHHHHVDVFAEAGKGVGGVGQHGRVVSRDLQGAVRNLNALPPAAFCRR